MEPFLNIKYKLERCDNLDELLDEMGESGRFSVDLTYFVVVTFQFVFLQM